jgi:hypothetical protein
VRTDFEDTIRRQSFGKKVPASVLSQRHVYIAQVVNHFAIELLGHALVEATISSFHVKDWNFAALGGNDG